MSCKQEHLFFEWYASVRIIDINDIRWISMIARRGGKKVKLITESVKQANISRQYLPQAETVNVYQQTSSPGSFSPP